MRRRHARLRCRSVWYIRPRWARERLKVTEHSPPVAISPCPQPADRVESSVTSIELRWFERREARDGNRRRAHS